MQESCVPTPNEPTLATRLEQIYNMACSLEQCCCFVDRKIFGDIPEPVHSSQKDPECVLDMLTLVCDTLNSATMHANRVADSLT